MENISSALVMVLGMGTVFVGLIMLILLTKLMSAVIGKGKGAEQAKAAPVGRRLRPAYPIERPLTLP